MSGKTERGSVTIEATISLSAFMFAIVTILTIVNICLIQSKISIAINDAAKELSQYSYLYSLTGIKDSKDKLAAAASENKEGIDGVLSDVASVFTEIQNLGKSDGEREVTDISGTLDSLKSIKDSGTELKGKLEDLAKDPKGVAIGLLKIIGNDGLDLAMSRLVAAPLAKGLSKKNLAFEKGGDVESFLKSCGVKPSAGGSYLDGLDFSKSTLFPDGSNEIRINVAYDVKVIALLPIDFSFHFNQTAVTQGWLAGSDSYRTTAEVLDKEENSNIWTEGTTKERSDLIRHLEIKNLSDAGYEQVCGSSYQYTQVYNSEKNEFVAINSMNPLYSKSGEDTLTLDDISETAIRENIEYLCAGVDTQTSGLKTIQTKKTDSNGSVIKSESKCVNATKTLRLVIPEDKGLSDKIQSIVDKSNTHGVKVELVAGYGNGARTTEVEPDGGKESE